MCTHSENKFFTDIESDTYKRRKHIRGLNMDEGVPQLSQSYIDPRDLHPHPRGKGSRSGQPGDFARLNLVSINTCQGHRELTARCLISSSNTSGIVEVHENSDLFISRDTCITSTGGSVVEFSPATREAWVRFPASARNCFFVFFLFNNLGLSSDFCKTLL